MIRLSVVGIAACAILSACSNYQPAGYGSAPGGWAPGVVSNPRSVPEPKILPETFYAAGQLFEAQGLLTKAAVQYRKATAVNHTFAAAYDRLGVTLGRLGKHTPAVEALQTAVQLIPESAAFHNNLAFEYVLLGRWSDAEAELIQAIDLEPNFDRAHINMGVVQANLERYVDALTEFRKVVAEADAYYNLGLLLCGQHRYADAASTFEYVLSLNSQFGAARVRLKQIGPKLTLANALEPRMTMPLETLVAQAATEGIEETYPVTATLVGELEADTEAEVVTDATTTATTTTTTNTDFELIEVSNTATQILLAVDTDCPDEWRWPINEEVETLVSLTYDPRIESPATIGGVKSKPDAPQELVAIDHANPTRQAGRTVLFSTVDGSTDRAEAQTDGLLDGDWDCANDREWMFPADMQWLFTVEEPFPASDIHQPLYDLEIESPAQSAEPRAIQPKKMIEVPAHTAKRAKPGKPSADAPASGNAWTSDDSLELPEPTWYRRTVGQTDDAE